MAWRDSRRSRARLLLFTSSIVLGIAALVSINSFKSNLQEDIDSQAKELLGADFLVRGNHEPSDSLLALLDSIPAVQAREKYFSSMILFPESGGTRLVQVRAQEGDYPFYGEIETTPADAARRFQQENAAIVDKTLLMQYGVEVGDSIKIGNATFPIIGAISNVPGQNGITSTVAPPVYIPLAAVEGSSLFDRGSRIEHRLLFRFDADAAGALPDAEALKERFEPPVEEEGLDIRTVADQKRSVGNTFRDLARFLNLCGFIALLLGCVGVASSVHIYVKEKTAAVAILRCLGATGRQAFYIFLIQIMVMGAIGSLLGASIGVFIQFGLPQVFGDFLPVQVTMSVSLGAIAQGVLTGLGVSLLFALLPLSGIIKTSPLRTLRASYEAAEAGAGKGRALIIVSIVLFIWLFSWWQIRDLSESLFFVLGLGVSFLLLWGLGKGLMWAVRRFTPATLSFTARQGLSNLYRPNNQTLVLIISIGLGTALVTTLFLVQGMLLDRINLSAKGSRPNMVLFDIRTEQKDSLRALTESMDMPIMQEVPVVTTRVNEINGYSRKEAEADSTLKIPSWAYDREYRVTYRNDLIESEKTLRGEWGEAAQRGDSIFISMEEGYAERLQLEIGDPVIWNVQGAEVETYVGHIREVDWARIQTNFLVLFPEGVLEKAPQFHVLVTRVGDEAQSASYQQAVVRQYPNISVIDLGLILQTVDEVLGKIAFVIRFMALFSILTGLIVLVGSVILSKYQRMRESVLLRTLGARRRQVTKIIFFEYIFLGSIASLSGIFIAFGAAAAMAVWSFEVPFDPLLWPVAIVYLLITGITVLIGLMNLRPVLNNPPLEVLRAELG